MKGRHRFPLTCSLLWTAIAACGLAWEPQSTRVLDLPALERQTIELAPKVQAATVGVVLSEEDIDANGIGYGGSGVIVSADGLVLTAAHVLEGSGDEVLVILPESRQVKARVCGYLGRGDLAVLQLVDQGPFSFLPMADVKKVAPGTICVCAGRTGRIDPQRPPPLRMGRVLGERQGEAFIDENGDAADLDRVLVSDAPFLPGDSGGPLVNLAGEVIGIHSSIGPDHRENLHVPIWQFQRHWAKLTGGVKRSLPKSLADELVLSELPHLGPLRRLPIFDYRITVERSWSSSHPNHLKRFAPVSQKLASPPVQVFADDRAVALGCVVDQGMIVTVATSVDHDKLLCRVAGKDHNASPFARDEVHNLALLRIDAADLKPIEWSNAAVPPIGAWLVSPGINPHPLAVSVVSLPRRNIPESVSDPQLAHGFLGVELQTKAKEARIGRIVHDSAASVAGLSINDVIHRVNEQVIQRGEELIETLRRFKPEEKVKLEISRGDMKVLLDVTLGRRPSQQQEDDAEFAAWNRSSGGVSVRKTNLPDVITHDGCISPKHCGGPVLDLQGRVVGLNIARADRTSTYALPADVVKQAVEKMLAEVSAKAAK
jgi:serine protease Do